MFVEILQFRAIRHKRVLTW